MPFNRKPDRDLKDTAQTACGRYNAAAILPRSDFPSSRTKNMSMRARLVVAVCGCLLAPEMAISQQTQPPARLGPQIVPLTAQSVYQGWRAADVLGDGVMSRANDELGTVKNILMGRDGSIEALIVESGGRPDIP